MLKDLSFVAHCAWEIQRIGYNTFWCLSQKAGEQQAAHFFFISNNTRENGALASVLFSINEYYICRYKINGLKEYFIHINDFNSLQIIALSVCTEGITVSPSLCPTNKIAPHRRVLTTKYGTQRTFGAFYDLLVPDNFQPNRPSLQEEPLNDPEDCGEIDDYDENDVGSGTKINFLCVFVF